MNGTLIATLAVAAIAFFASWGFGLMEKESRAQGPYFTAPAEIAGCATVFLFFVGVLTIALIFLFHYGWGCLIWPWEPAICGAR